MQPLKSRGAAEQRPNQPVNCRNIFFNWYHKFTGRNKCTTDPIRGKTVIPAPRIRGGKLRRESTAYRRGKKNAINYVHLLIYFIPSDRSQGITLAIEP